MQGSQITDSKIINEIKYSKKKESDVLLKEKLLTISHKPDTQIKIAIEYARQPGASSWLYVIPLEQYGFSLTKLEFRDAILLRYGKELNGLASYISFWPGVRYYTCVKL